MGKDPQFQVTEILLSRNLSGYIFRILSSSEHLYDVWNSSTSVYFERKWNIGNLSGSQEKKIIESESDICAD